MGGGVGGGGGGVGGGQMEAVAIHAHMPCGPL